MKKLIFIHVVLLWAPIVASPILSPNGPVYITNGGSLALTCEIDQDAAYVTWIRNSYSIMQITNSTICSFRTLNSLDTYNYSMTCDQQRRFSMVKYRVNSSDDNTTWNCQIFSLNYTDLGTSLAVKVLMHFPVDSVKLLNGTTLTLIENQSALFVCETNASRPSAAVYWMKDGINITDSPTNVTAVSVGSDLFVSWGTLTYTGQRGDSRKILTCGAYNGLDSVQISGNLTIIIYYPPSILGLPNPYKVIEYQSLNVTCQVSSNPPPDRIFWTPTGEGSVPSTLYFSSMSRNNKGDYSCTAQNTMTPTVGNQENGTTSSQIQVDVLYSPSIQGLISLYKVIEFQPLNVTCRVISNPPPDQIFWTPAGEGSVPSTLYFSSMSRNKSGTYSCTAQNTMIPTAGGQQTGTSTNQIQVDVLYPPSIQGLTSSYRVIEFQSLSVTCQVSSNPPPDRIFWTPTGEGSVPFRLYFSTVSRNNSGTYSCRAQNTMIPTIGNQQNGTNTSQIEVDVLYAAKITKFVAKGNISEILENSSLELYCHVESNPYSVISLAFGDVLISTIQNSNELIHNSTARCLDAGKYICSATNSVMNGVTASAEISVKVQCGPRLDHRQNISTLYYRVLNDNVTFEVNIIAYPEPTDIMWYHRGSNADKWQQVPNQPISSSGLFSTITVHLGSPADFGDYLVNMTNSFGIYDRIFHIIQESPPQTVDIFYISRFVSNQIELYFKPGFNGGRVQTFVLEYKSTSSPDPAWRNSSVTDLKETQTTNGTYYVNVTQPPPGTYEYRMYSWNDIGRSPYSAVIPIFIPEGTCKTSCADTMENTNQNKLTVVAAVLFGLAICLFVVAIVLIIHSRRGICSGCMNGRSIDVSLLDSSDTPEDLIPLMALDLTSFFAKRVVTVGRGGFSIIMGLSYSSMPAFLLRLGIFPAAKQAVRLVYAGGKTSLIKTSEMDPEMTDIGLGQPSIYDDLSALHASTSGKTREDYEQLNHGNTAEHEEPSNDHTTVEYEEPSKGSKSQSKFGNHVYGNTTVTSNM